MRTHRGRLPANRLLANTAAAATESGAWKPTKNIRSHTENDQGADNKDSNQTGFTAWDAELATKLFQVTGFPDHDHGEDAEQKSDKHTREIKG